MEKRPTQDKKPRTVRKVIPRKPATAFATSARKMLFRGAIVITMLLVVVGTAWAALANYSGSITTGGIAQTVAPQANGKRSYFIFQNVSSDTLWIDFGAVAVQDQPSLKLLPGASYEPVGYIDNDYVSVIGPNTGAKFVCKTK
jgi:hypothetical protein